MLSSIYIKQSTYDSFTQMVHFKMILLGAPMGDNRAPLFAVIACTAYTVVANSDRATQTNSQAAETILHGD